MADAEKSYELLVSENFVFFCLVRRSSIKTASRELKKRLYALICKIWKDEKMPDDWKVGLIVPLFKKGDKRSVKIIVE